MPLIDAIVHRQGDMIAWRWDLHAHPETAFEEHRTADVLARYLASFGLEVHRGLARTGVVGTLKNGAGGAIGLRADMDGLAIPEANTFAHRSTRSGAMHGCGHDGHMAMLLGAARHLAETRAFQGTVHFIFQPAEENEAGGRIMVEEGLFDKFPVDAVFGMHNWPSLEAGRIGVRSGPVMAACDVFELVVAGRGAHGAMPHLAIDPVVVAAEMVLALQTIVGRNTDPLQPAVLSITQIQAGDTWNVIPDRAVLRGTARAFSPEVRMNIETAIQRVAEGVAAAHGAGVTIRHERRYPPTINPVRESDLAAGVAALVVGEDRVSRDVPPSMGSEDFAFMLERRPGCYVRLGAGPAKGFLHSPGFDFNDDILAIGASFWVKLVETALGG
jgi:amidohydrolase